MFQSELLNHGAALWRLIVWDCQCFVSKPWTWLGCILKHLICFKRIMFYIVKGFYYYILKKKTPVKLLNLTTKWPYCLEAHIQMTIFLLELALYCLFLPVPKSAPLLCFSIYHQCKLVSARTPPSHSVLCITDFEYVSYMITGSHET